MELDEAIKIVVFAPFLTLAMGILLFMPLRFIAVAQTTTGGGPFSSVLDTLTVVYQVAATLLQLASTVEFWIAVGVILTAILGIASRLGSGF